MQLSMATLGAGTIFCDEVGSGWITFMFVAGLAVSSCKHVVSIVLRAKMPVDTISTKSGLNSLKCRQSVLSAG